jgi:hypothetical protein
MIVDQLIKGTNHSKLLVQTMLDILKKELGPIYYRCFVENGPPDSWCFIVRFNSDHKPYIEFLHKSGESDAAPSSQINGYSLEYMALCKYVVKQILEEARRQTPLAKKRAISHPPSPKYQQLQQQQQPQQKRRPQPKPRSQTLLQSPQQPNLQEQARRFGPPVACSTPQRQRILPHRACKTSFCKSSNGQRY